MPQGDKKAAAVLALERDAERARMLEKSLGCDYRLEIARDSAEMLQMASKTPPDLMLVDVVSDSHLQICRSLKAVEALERVPLLMLADEEGQRLKGLELGAMECLPGSFCPDVLRATVRNFVRWKKVCDSLAESERSARKKIHEMESVFQMVAHDLKSPVIAIHGFVKILERRFARMAPDKKRDEILLFLSRASKSIQDFLTDLAELMVRERLELELAEVSLRETVEDVVNQHRELMEQKRVAIELDFRECPAKVVVDRRRLTQVLDNLILNAIGHMGEISDAVVRIGFSDAPDFVVTCVSDNGVGISPEYHDQVFSRFFRVPGEGRKSGTGLGLAIVKTIIESHGGTIWVESRVGEGAAFKFTLPKVLPECRAVVGEEPVPLDQALH